MPLKGVDNIIFQLSYGFNIVRVSNIHGGNFCFTGDFDFITDNNNNNDNRTIIVDCHSYSSAVNYRTACDVYQISIIDIH